MRTQEKKETQKPSQPKVAPKQTASAGKDSRSSSSGEESHEKFAGKKDMNADRHAEKPGVSSKEWQQKSSKSSC